MRNPTGGDRWEIEEDNWSGQRKTLGRLASGCEMEVKSLPGNLLFTHGCVPAHGEASWYRVLDLKGATVLKGKPEPFELLQQAETDEAGKLFAIASTQFDRRVALNGTMRGADFSPLSVSVYST